MYTDEVSVALSRLTNYHHTDIYVCNLNKTPFQWLVNVCSHIIFTLKNYILQICNEFQQANEQNRPVRNNLSV